MPLLFSSNLCARSRCVTHAYTEDQPVDQPAKAKPPSPLSSPGGSGDDGLFTALGWAVAGPPPNAGVAGEPRDAGLLGRETKGEVVLVSRLRAALERLNPALPPEAITAAVDELTRDRSAMLKNQIQTLRRMRDLLLPRLLSWQVELSTAEVSA